jgi:hypothetical protein
MIKKQPLIISFIVMLLVSSLTTSFAQDGPQTVRDEDLKVQFIVPSGWSVTKKDIGYVMVPYETPDGFILVEVDSFVSVKELKVAMTNGITQEDGEVLTPIAELADLGSQGVAGLYEGMVDEKEVKGFLMALMPPSGGKAAIAIVVAPAEYFNQSHIDELKLLFRSIIFL